MFIIILYLQKNINFYIYKNRMFVIFLEKEFMVILTFVNYIAASRS